MQELHGINQEVKAIIKHSYARHHYISSEQLIKLFNVNVVLMLLIYSLHLHSQSVVNMLNTSVCPNHSISYWSVRQKLMSLSMMTQLFHNIYLVFLL